MEGSSQFLEENNSYEWLLLSAYETNSFSHLDKDVKKYCKKKYGSVKSYIDYVCFTDLEWKRRIIRVIRSHKRGDILDLLKKDLLVKDRIKDGGYDLIIEAYETFVPDFIREQTLDDFTSECSGVAIDHGYAQITLFRKKISFFDYKRFKFFPNPTVPFIKLIARIAKRDINRLMGIKIEDHIGLVKKVISMHFSYVMPYKDLYEEALSAGIEGMVKSFGSYNPEKSKLSTFICRGIRMHITRSLENFHPFLPYRIPSHVINSKSICLSDHFYKSTDYSPGDREPECLKQEDTTPQEKDVKRDIYELVEKEFGTSVAKNFLETVFEDKDWREKKSIKTVKNYIAKEYYGKDREKT